MSYSIDIYSDGFTLYSDNYTSNVAPIMYYTAWDEVKESLKDVNDCDDWKCAIQEEQDQALPALKAIISELQAHPEKYKKMNPGNDWGNYEGAIEFLDNARRVMENYSRARIRLDW